MNAYEALEAMNEGTAEDEIRGLQALVNSGDAWRLEGAIGRAAMDAIEAGVVALGDEGHHDYYGNYVPSRHEVEAGTKGSPEYVAEHGNEILED